MAKNRNPYRKLPGKRRYLWGYHTLWMGPDHLLSVSNNTFSESYKRFYYNDIQAFVTTKARAFPVVATLLGILGGLCLISSYFLSDGPIDTGTVAGVTFLVALGIYLLGGTTCHCYLKTAVQMEKLPSLYRFRLVRKALSRIRPEVESAQGLLDTGSLRRFVEETAAAHAGPRYRPETTGSKTNKTISGRWHGALFITLVIVGLFAMAGLFHQHPVMMISGNALLGVVTICGIVAVVRQYGSGMGPGLKTLSWAALGWVGVLFVLGTIYYFIFLFENMSNQALIQNQFSMIIALSGVSPRENSFLMAIYLITLIPALIMGGTGLVLLGRMPARGENPDSAGPVDGP